MKRIITIVVFAAVFAAAILSTKAQLIINGGFETPDVPTFIGISAGQNTIAPWVVSMHSVEVGDAVGNGFLIGPAFEGAQFLDLTGTGRGRITQSFATGIHKIFTSALQPDESFGEPVQVTELNAPGFNTFRPNVSPDGLEIFFDSDRPGGLGGTDIWAAIRRSASDEWSAPFNLGPNVNSASAETRASLSADGQRLTFGSARPGGEGSSDIYVYER